MARGFYFGHFRSDAVSSTVPGNLVNLQVISEAVPVQRKRPDNLPESDPLVQDRPCEAGRFMLQKRDDVPGCRTTILQDRTHVQRSETSCRFLFCRPRIRSSRKRAQRPRLTADENIQDVITDLRRSLRKLTDPAQRRIMMSYGARYKFLPGEPEELLPEAESVEQAPAAAGA